MTYKKTLAEQSVDIAQKLKSTAESTALAVFTNLMKEDLTKTLTESIDASSNGKDQPAGYDIDGGQKRISDVGDSFEDLGDGPALIEGDEPDGDEAPAPAAGGDEEDLDMNMPGAQKENPFAKKPEMATEGEEEDTDDEEEIKTEGETEPKSAEKEGDKEIAALKKENIQYKRIVATLKKENADLSKSLSFINKSLKETSLINSKMAYIQKILAKYPTLKYANTRKVVESIDSAKSHEQAKIIYETAVSAIDSVLAKKAENNNTTSRAKQIVESANKNKSVVINEGSNEIYSRFAALAGLND